MVRSNTETTSEDNEVTLNTTRSTNIKQNTLEHVTNFSSTTEVSSLTQEPMSANNSSPNTPNSTSAEDTTENEDLIETTRSTSNADTNSIEIENTSNASLSTDTSTSEDFATIIESDVDINTNTTYQEAVSKADNVTNVNGTKRITTKEPYKQPFSMKHALRDIAYYLRAYKFNEYDRRYETNAETAPRRYFKEFPRPPLRSLHWEVHKYCEPSFSGCVDYLRKRIRLVSLKRADDTTVVMQEQNWTMTNHSEQIKQIDEECKKLKKIGNNVAEPFEGPIERFQWRVTASYYMCWYTMQQVPEMKHLSEHCDNFADCLDNALGPNNKDVRANDSDPYACALYSFCPNPCCPMRHLTKYENCWNSAENPCFIGNVAGQRECAVNRSSNTEFRDIILNRWNVTCRCPQGYEWNSRFGMCIDVDECERGGHNCDRKLHQGCLNLAGSFRCACMWGHVWNPTEKQCIASKALHHLKLSNKKDTGSSGEKSESLIRKLTKFFRRSAANTLRFDKIALLPNLLWYPFAVFLALVEDVNCATYAYMTSRKKKAYCLLLSDHLRQ
ncbi:uncharacterized protein LOC111692090 [Anoplophora glabripennis]|uniref:uncharacterized protein LOC111692090 n=1 Tax=Anoplophora glabripennis TaxID=217634 RepID=UPI000C78075A|nr:uncharacterized protein LOC111692090 [Anoplophora glabripennis]